MSQMGKAWQKVTGQEEVLVVEGRVLTLLCHETCCVYIVTDKDGHLSEVKRCYVQMPQGINIEDNVR